MNKRTFSRHCSRMVVVGENVMAGRPSLRAISMPTSVFPEPGGATTWNVCFAGSRCSKRVEHHALVLAPLVAKAELSEELADIGHRVAMLTKVHLAQTDVATRWLVGGLWFESNVAYQTAPDGHLTVTV
jgi:hypothetical protein